MKEVIHNFGKKSEFASFLPGIAGYKGVPIWCFYVNRGQGVVSFGVDNKDHAIMEFYPAHVAYQTVKTTGFRTFMLCDDAYYEPFAEEEFGASMEIEKNRFMIAESNEKLGVKTEVTYFVLPEEPIGALVRKVVITNTGAGSKKLQVIDGMPAVIAYGVDADSTKNMTQTAKAWMQVEDLESKTPFYRVRVSMNDSAEVTGINGGNFAFGVDENGQALSVIVDPESIFSYDKSLQNPVVLKEGGLSAVMNEKQNTSNLIASAFFVKEKELASGESLYFYEMIGQVSDKKYFEAYKKNLHDRNYFEEKEARAVYLADELCKGIATKTANETFDAYCQNAYMDNVLRGGYPIKLGKDKIFYVYSRKHGDLERDYNYFTMLPEYYTQGNGNFRDVNQNRRMDSFFNPYVGRENIHIFYDLIQLDGYNPLSIEKLTYHIEGDAFKEVKAKLSDSFTPGQLYRILLDMDGINIDETFEKIMDLAKENSRASFGEGYWCDHWTYNLDLIEEYLAVFPEKEEEMLKEENYTFFTPQVRINDRTKRYAKTENGIRQYHALDESSMRNTKDKRQKDVNGNVIYTTLQAKLVLLCAMKFAALDPYGMGIEMEGGKPGWYDALNGAPGMFGSSVSETYELNRMLTYTIHSLEAFPGEVELLEEAAVLIRKLSEINSANKDAFAFWNEINDAKEAYRNETFVAVSGKTVKLSSSELLSTLKGFLQTVEKGIKKACSYGNICPTYFTYEVTDYKETDDGIVPLGFDVKPVPYFLEGPVRYLKLNPDDKKELYQRVKSSDLYDKKLSMYKVNASLEDASFELGRAKAFTPGWLENESIFLHMEYKYLLELLKSGLYEEFFEDFHAAAVPFLDPEVYGRSTLENSSFLASSKNPNEKIHGKGFVARLSGSTVEFLSMWKRMMFGKSPFYLEDGELKAKLLPALPAYLIGEDRQVCATFLGNTKVTYEFAEIKNYIPGNYVVTETCVFFVNGESASFEGGLLDTDTAIALRDGRVESVLVKIK